MYDAVAAIVGPEFQLGQDLVGEGGGHDEAGMAHGTAQVDQTALRQDYNVAPIGKGVAVHLQDKTVMLYFKVAAPSLKLEIY